MKKRAHRPANPAFKPFRIHAAFALLAWGHAPQAVYAGGGECDGMPNGTPCTDTNSNECSFALCSNGVCNQSFLRPAGFPCTDGDGNVCTGVGCDGLGQCDQHAPPGAPCPDTDGNECTIASCNGAGACLQSVDAPNGTPCTDTNLNECTFALCSNGVCNQSFLRPAGFPCTDGDGNVCTGVGCDGLGQCDQHAPPGAPCPDTDGNECTIASCNGAGACLQSVDAPNGTPCTDTNLNECTFALCSNGVCNQSFLRPAGFPCTDGDGNSCTGIGCNGLGQCNQDATPGTSCTDTDGNDCTMAECDTELDCDQRAVCDDDDDPIPTCPVAMVSVQCADDIPPFEPTFMDDCDDNLTLQPDSTVSEQSCPNRFLLDRSVVARDDCGNESRCDQTVTVFDNTPPMIRCPDDLVLTCALPEGVPVTSVMLRAIAADNCGTVTVDDDRPADFYAPTCGREGPTVVTFIATDACGNTGECEVEVEVFGAMCCPGVSSGELALLPASIDLRQDNDGPTLTKAKFDIWNQNEVRFSGTEKCVACWDQELLSTYSFSNHFLLRNLHTDKGRARIDGVASPAVCAHPDLMPSVNVPLLGVLIKQITFDGQPPQVFRSAITPPGTGREAAVIRYDAAGALTLPVVATPDLLVPAADIGQEPTAFDGTSPAEVAPAGPSSANRVASVSEKGSLLVFPSIEVKWNANGQVIQDSFIEMSNDRSTPVRVQLYFVQGDPPLPRMTIGNPPVLVERAHEGWNKVDAMVLLTGDQPTYWSALRGLPLGVQPWTVLDPVNPPGRPDPDPANVGGRVLRGFILAWAVNSSGQEINWNHLSGAVTVLHYGLTSAWDYLPWAFECVSGVATGSRCDATSGELSLDGIEYDYVPDKLLVDFYAVGSEALSR